MPCFRRFLFPLLLTVLFLAVPSTCRPVLAQSVLPGAPEKSDEAAPAKATEETDALIESLKDPEKRELLLRQLEILRAAQELDQSAAERKQGESGTAATGSEGADKSSGDATSLFTPDGSGALVVLDSMVDDVRANIEDSWNWLGELKVEITNLDRTTASPKFRAFWAAFSLKLLLILVVAGLIAGVTHYMLRHPIQRLLGEASSVSRLVWRNTAGVLLKLLPGALFGISGYGLVLALDLAPTTSLVAMALISAQTGVLLIMAVGTLHFAVIRGRIMPAWFTDEATSFLRRAILQLAITLCYGVMMIELADAMGVDRALIRLLVHIVGFVTVVIILFSIFRLRRILALHEQLEEAKERDAEASGQAADQESGAVALATRSMARAENTLRRNWASFATIITLGFYLLWLVAPVEVLLFCLRGAVLTVLVALLLRVLSRLIRRVFAQKIAEEGAVLPRGGVTWLRFRVYAGIVRRAALAILVALAGILILQIWGVDFLAWLTSPTGQRFAASVVKIMLFIIGGIVLSELFSIAVETYLHKRSAEYSDLTRRSRARTLLPLLRNVVRVTLGTIITMLVLGEIGVEIGPMLAAAGVVGLAVGFGAQTLVKDIITGIFILIEDTIAVGDVVDLEGNAGVVESMTIRTVRLRDQAGTVHSIPFSAITKVMNMTRDFSYAVFDIGIAYDQDIGQVMDVVKAVAADLRKDPAVSRDILEPIEILGVDRFADSAVIIKARIKTRPIRQWDVGRRFNWLLKEAFDAANIEIPFPQRTMHIVRPKKSADSVAAPETHPERPPEDGKPVNLP